MIEFEEESDYSIHIKVVGVGGAGGIVIDKMLDWGSDLDLMAVDTDASALKQLRVPRKVRIGAQLTKGLGAGGNPDIGRKAIYQERERVKEILTGADLVFIVAGLGGGTGTGAGPFIAELASELGAITVAVVTKPFIFEGARRIDMAEIGLKEFRKVTDTLIPIPNEKLFADVKTDSFLLDAFNAANRMQVDVVKAVVELVGFPGTVNLDFADVRDVLRKSGEASFGVGIGNGKLRGKEAVESALNSPLLKEIDVSSGKNFLISIAGEEDLTQEEVNGISNAISKHVGSQPNKILGVVIDKQLKGKIRLTLVVMGLTPTVEKRQMQVSEKKFSSGFTGGQRVYLGRFEDELDVPTFIRKGLEGK